MPAGALSADAAPEPIFTLLNKSLDWDKQQRLAEDFTHQEMQRYPEGNTSPLSIRSRHKPSAKRLVFRLRPRGLRCFPTMTAGDTLLI
ncbi:MAG: hypothetical protein ACTXOO_00795 [Sodalis sp. (in: enterobacteria)]